MFPEYFLYLILSSRVSACKIFMMEAAPYFPISFYFLKHLNTDIGKLRALYDIGHVSIC